MTKAKNTGGEEWEKGKQRGHLVTEKKKDAKRRSNEETLAGQNKKLDYALKGKRKRREWGKYGWWNNLETKWDKRDGRTQKERQEIRELETVCLHASA